MARIPDEQIERLKQEVSLVRLVESQGYRTKRQGKDYVIRCPFHEDDTPSLVISPSNNLYHCFGCGAAGSVIDWTMKTQGLSFRHAVELLRSGEIVPVAANTESAKPVKRNTRAKHPCPLAADPDRQATLKRVIDYYHETLKQNPEALEYLASRGLQSAELIERFKLGYANRTLGYRLPEKNRKAGAEIRGQLQEIGILRESGHEHFRGSLVVPVMDENGVISEVYGRKLLGNRLRKGTPQHLYLSGSHQGVWNIEALKASREIILCEALIDAMTFWVNGYRNVTASYGTEGFTDDHLAAFKQHATQRVLIAYDRDETGNRAAEKVAKVLMENGMDVFRIQLPKGMDVNEYALQVTPAPKSLGLVIRKAQWLGKGQAPELSTAPGDNPLTHAKPIEEPVEEPTESPALAADLPPPTEASPLPEPPQPIEAEVNDQELSLTLGERRYRIRGLHKNLSYEQLNVNLLVSRGEAVHIDSFDLYNARHRNSFINQAAGECGVHVDVIKKDLGKVLLKLEVLQEKQIKQTLEPEEQKPVLDDDEQQAALVLLKDNDLLQRILEDFHAAGMVGEETNKLVGYLACVSRKLDKPLAVIIQSTSAAGKSSLMDAVLNLMPEEERVQYSAMTGQSLFYMGETNLKNKILAIAADTDTGIPDRAIMETLYSTGMRRMEVIRLNLHDIDSERGTVMIRQGKGKKDRMVPIGERALAWITKYRDQVRPNLALADDDGTLFLTHLGEAFTRNRMTQLVRDYVNAAETGKSGSCHLFRHTMATLMLENGADIRFIQAMLGHANVSTTQIYTQVSIRKLKEIHTVTHPARMQSGRQREAEECLDSEEDAVSAE